VDSRGVDRDAAALLQPWTCHARPRPAPADNGVEDSRLLDRRPDGRRLESFRCTRQSHRNIVTNSTDEHRTSQGWGGRTMDRRKLLAGLAGLASCPLCARQGAAAEAVHWSYDGEAGPDHWGSLSPANAVCAAGSQQSPLDIAGTIKAEIPAIGVDWKKDGQ